MDNLTKLNLDEYKPLRDVVFESLREAILEGRLSPGQRLMEVQLADQLGVSRTPVREAIRKLELEGLVVMLPRKGAYVANMSLKDIIDVLEIRASLEGLSASLAAERIHEEDIIKLEKIAEEFKVNTVNGNVEGLLKADVEFHECIFKATNNKKLHQLINSLWEQVYRFRVTYVSDYDSSVSIIKEHELIYGEIKKVEAASVDYKNKLIRFHVIANSDSDEDQALKLKVRDAVIEYLQPKLSKSGSIQESEEIIKAEYDNLEKISKNIICENGYNYDVRVGIEYSNFPTKQYSNVVLPAGEYKALKIIIGSGEGKNWWCVMFPPLCFVDEQKGIIDKETDRKLKEVLSEEEYSMITQKDQSEVSRVKVKFKVIEVLQDIF